MSLLNTELNVYFGKENNVDNIAIAIEKYSKSASIESELRKYILNYMNKNEYKNFPIKKLMKLFVCCIKRKFTLPKNCITILADIFYITPIQYCSNLFNIMTIQLKNDEMKELLENSKIIMLRMCNNLLKRISKTIDSEFSFNVQKYLSSLFPLSEKSGLNLLSEINDLDLDIDAESDCKIASLKEKNVVDETPSCLTYELYRSLWVLQEYCRNPLNCYIPEKWKHFQGSLVQVLRCLRSRKLIDNLTAQDSICKEITKKKFLRYLTNSKLTCIQIENKHFRKCLLIQLHILVNFILSHENIKRTNLSINEENIKWLCTIEKLIVELMLMIPHIDKTFVASIKFQCTHDRMWENWKNEGCAKFAKEDITDVLEGLKCEKETKAFTFSDYIDELEDETKSNFDISNLSHHWIVKQNFNQKISEKPVNVPAITNYFDKAAKELEDDSITKNSRMTRNEFYNWIALRVISTSKVSMLLSNNPNDQKLSLQEYVEVIIKKSFNLNNIENNSDNVVKNTTNTEPPSKIQKIK